MVEIKIAIIGHASEHKGPGIVIWYRTKILSQFN